MDVWTLMRTALRRWYVFIPVVGASLALGYSMASDLDPVYTTESSAILTAPEIVPGTGLQAGELIEVNPYLNLGGGLTTTTQVMVVLMDSQPQRLDYLDRGLEPDYEVSRTDAVIFFTVTGTDEAAVTATANELVAIADDEIAILQDRTDVPPEQRIRVRPLSLPEEAIEDGGAGTQLMAILGVLGLVAALAAAVALDGFLRWRHARRADRLATEPEPTQRPDEALAARTVKVRPKAKAKAPVAEPVVEPDWLPAAEQAVAVERGVAAADDGGTAQPAETPAAKRQHAHERRADADDNHEVRVDNPAAGQGDHADLPNLPRRTPGASQPETVSAPTGSTTT